VTGETEEVDFDFLHLVPPQTPHEVIAKSPLAAANGYVDVHAETL
jgi:sulfide:quinone oxidoreductase